MKNPQKTQYLVQLKVLHSTQQFHLLKALLRESVPLKQGLGNIIKTKGNNHHLRHNLALKQMNLWVFRIIFLIFVVIYAFLSKFVVKKSNI